MTPLSATYVTDLEAIAEADSLRPNRLSQTEKQNWLLLLDTEVAEMMGVSPPEAVGQNENTGRELLLPAPYAKVYILYLCYMIDFSQGDPVLMEKDGALFDNRMAYTKAQWRRLHTPEKEQKIII